MSYTHGPNCGCGLCVALGRIHFFSTHIHRDPRFLFVASTRLRILYTQLVDLAEGFCPATEIAGQPYITDPRPPPGVLSVPATSATVAQGQGESAPATKGGSDIGLASCPKAKASAPREPAPESEEPAPPAPQEELPRQREPKDRKKSRSRKRERGEKKRREESSQERKSKDRSRRNRALSSSPRGSDRKEKKKNKRSRSRRRRPSPSFDRKREERPVTPERKGDQATKSEGTRVKKERTSSEPLAEPVRPARRPSRDQGRSAAGSRVPRPPEGPPPGRSQWSGPIRAPRPDHQPEFPNGRVDWGKSKGVKRREKNQAFRAANYSSGWDNRYYR